MSMELISREEVKKLLNEGWYSGVYPSSAIMSLPTVEAIPIEKLEQIRAEMQELIDWHDCPIEYDNGNDYWYCQAVNQCISKLDKVLKEQTT